MSGRHHTGPVWLRPRHDGFDADVLIADFRWGIGDRGEVYFNSSLALTDAEFDRLLMGLAATSDTASFPSGLPGPGPGGAPLPAHDLDLSDVREFSDLEFREVRATIGFDYLLRRGGPSLFGSLSVYDVDDDFLEELTAGDPTLQDFTDSVAVVSGGLHWSL